MQDILKKIFELATSELPSNHFRFQKEEAVMFKGFKISKDSSGYKWEDMRYSDFYEPVDPKITEQILLKGFEFTLSEVMAHNNIFKLEKISREIEVKDSLISYWVTESTKIYAEYNKKRTSINKDSRLTAEVKKRRKDSLRKRYEKNRDLYQKKRRVISEQREELKADKKFFESRTKLYNN